MFDFAEALAKEMRNRFTVEEVEEVLSRKGSCKLPLEFLVDIGTHDFRNDTEEIQHFFSTPDKPVSHTEMKEFWLSLTVRERIQYKDSYEIVK